MASEYIYEGNPRSHARPYESYAPLRLLVGNNNPYIPHIIVPAEDL